MKKNYFIPFSLLILLQSSFLHAESANNEMHNVGKQKAIQCASCHGEQGNSKMPMFPKLAQQHASYLIQQLKAFKDGTRKDPMMNGLAAALSENDMTDIAQYYASQRIDAEHEVPEDDADELKKRDVALKLGTDLYRNGDLNREVSACIACHGPHGEGNKPASFPALRAQHADYIAKALQDFKSGARGNHAENMMHMIAKKMTDDEIKAVAYRISMMNNQ